MIDPGKVILMHDLGPRNQEGVGVEGTPGAQEPRWSVSEWLTRRPREASGMGRGMNGVSLKEQAVLQDEGEYRCGLGSQEDCRLIL